jgi:hypothetical protein
MLVIYLSHPVDDMVSGNQVFKRHFSMTAPEIWEYCKKLLAMRIMDAYRKIGDERRLRITISLYNGVKLKALFSSSAEE